jgi:hypothetical protein
MGLIAFPKRQLGGIEEFNVGTIAIRRQSFFQYYLRFPKRLLHTVVSAGFTAAAMLGIGLAIGIEPAPLTPIPER